jgi:hypothetical protein
MQCLALQQETCCEEPLALLWLSISTSPWQDWLLQLLG